MSCATLLADDGDLVGGIRAPIHYHEIHRLRIARDKIVMTDQKPLIG